MSNRWAKNMDVQRSLEKSRISKWSHSFWIVVTMAIMSATPVILMIVFRQQIASMGWQSYLGLFLLSLVSASGTITVGVPVAVPGLLITYLAGEILNPIWVGLVGGIGAGLGECFSYPVGIIGKTMLKRGKIIDWLTRLMSRYGGWVIFLGAMIPNPAFDLVGLVAGLSGYPFPNFMILVMAGRILRALAVSYLGYYSTL